MLNFRRFLKVGLSTWFKSKPFFQCFEHAECIAIDTFNLLGNAWLNALGRGALMMFKNTHTHTHTHTFSSTKLLTRVTVADKLVLVNPF